MLEGLWTINFSGLLTGSGSGTVTLLPAGRVLGGDDTHYFVGSFTTEGTTFTAKLLSKPFVPGAKNILNTIGSLLYEAKGTISGDAISGTASVSGVPQTVSFTLTKREPLEVTEVTQQTALSDDDIESIATIYETYSGEQRYDGRETNTARLAKALRSLKQKRQGAATS